jgi:serine/threonine protein kinase
MAVEPEHVRQARNATSEERELGPYGELLEDMDADPRRGESWTWAQLGPYADQGWKLHITSWTEDAERTLRTVVPELVDQNVSFKVAPGPSPLKNMNIGESGETQVGKFMTIYPPTRRIAVDLAETLAEATARAEVSGPPVPTDLWLGGSVYTRYGSFKSELQYRDALGGWKNALEDPDGEPYPDIRKEKFDPPPWVDLPFEALVEDRPGEEDDRDPVDVETLPRHARVGEYVVVDNVRTEGKTNFHLAIRADDPDDVGIVLLKEAPQDTLADDSTSLADMLHLEYERTKELAAVVNAPEVWEPFEFNGSHYLPIEHIQGMRWVNLHQGPIDPDHRHPFVHMLERLSTVCEEVQSLHDHGWIHADLSPDNFMIDKDEQAVLLDLELASEIGSELPNDWGTPGYASPEQLDGEPAHPADDVFALASVAAELLTGLDPRYVRHARALPDGQPRLSKLSKFDLPDRTEQVLGEALVAERAERPDLAEVREAIETLARDLEELEHDPPTAKELQQVEPQDVLQGFVHETPRSGEGLWLIDKSNEEEEERELGLRRQTMRGVAGVLYSIARFGRFGVESPALSKAEIRHAVDWLVRHEPTDDDQMPGLHWGEAGVCLSIVELVEANLLEAPPWLYEYIHDTFTAAPIEWPDVTHGAAGRAQAAFAIADLLGDPEILEYGRPFLDHLVEIQRDDGFWELDYTGKDVEPPFTGFAHGGAGIMANLAEGYERIGDPKYLDAAEATASALLDMARDDIDQYLHFPRDTAGGSPWYYWCHGGPGIALAFTTLWEVTGDEEYLDAAIRANKPMPHADSGISQCHGLAGNGEIDLDIANVLDRHGVRSETAEVLRDRAREYGAYIWRRRTVHGNGRITWKNEDYDVPLPDLYGNSGGVSHFLLRVVNPEAERSLSMPLHTGPLTDAVVS